MIEPEETYFNIKIEKASIGEYAKEINEDLLLEYSKEKLRLVSAKGNKGVGRFIFNVVLIFRRTESTFPLVVQANYRC